MMVRLLVARMVETTANQSVGRRDSESADKRDSELVDRRVRSTAA